MSSPSTAPEPTPRGWSFLHFEKGAKVLAAFTIGFYGLGLLVSNVFLVSLGISDFSSLRPKFVLTGAWVFLMYAFSSLPGLLAALHVYRFARGRANLWRISWIAIVCIPVAVGLNLGWTSVLTQNVHVWSFYWAEWAVGSVVIAAAPWFITSQFPEDARTPWIFFHGALILFSFLGFSYAMAKGVYSCVPEAYGGGRAIEVKLYFNKDGSQFWKGLDADTCTQGNPESTGTPVYILYQNDRELVIGTCVNPSDPKDKKSFRVITVNRNLLDGIVQVESPDF